MTECARVYVVVKKASEASMRVTGCGYEDMRLRSEARIGAAATTPVSAQSRTASHPERGKVSVRRNKYKAAIH